MIAVRVDPDAPYMHARTHTRRHAHIRLIEYHFFETEKAAFYPVAGAVTNQMICNGLDQLIFAVNRQVQLFFERTHQGE